MCCTCQSWWPRADHHTYNERMAIAGHELSLPNLGPPEAADALIMNARVAMGWVEPEPEPEYVEEVEEGEADDGLEPQEA